MNYLRVQVSSQFWMTCTVLLSADARNKPQILKLVELLIELLKNINDIQ
jgi:hypothetical protein